MKWHIGQARGPRWDLAAGEEIAAAVPRAAWQPCGHQQVGCEAANPPARTVRYSLYRGCMLNFMAARMNVSIDSFAHEPSINPGSVCSA